MGLETAIESFYERVDEWPAIIASPKPYRNAELCRDRATQADVEADVQATRGKLRQFADLVRETGYSAREERRLGWALNMMYETHSGDERIVGLPYEHHPLHITYKALKRLRPGSSDLLEDLLLHDTLEDTDAERRARRSIRTRLGRQSLSHIRRLTTDEWSSSLRNAVAGSVSQVTGVDADGAMAITDNLEYASVVSASIQEDQRALLGKAFDGGDNMFYLHELSGHEEFRRRVSNKYALIIPAILHGLRHVDVERLGVEPSGVASLRQRYLRHVDEVVGYARRWRYHDDQMAFLRSSEELEGVEHDEYDTERRIDPVKDATMAWYQ